MVGFMKGLGCGCCSQGGGHCVGTPCSTFYPNYYCPGTFLVDEFPRVAEFASQSEVCGPWGYRRGLSPLNSCRTDPPIAFGTYFESRPNFNTSGGTGTIGAQWRSAKESTFTFTQNSYGIISPWEWDAASPTSRWAPRSQVTNYRSWDMATTFRRAPGPPVGGSIVCKNYGGPFYTETEMVPIVVGGINAGVGYETRLKIFTPTGIAQTTLLIYDPLQSPYSSLDPQPFVKSFIDIYIDSTIVLQWGNSNTVNVTSTIDYSGRYFYARSVPPDFVEWQSKTTPETFSGSLTRSFSLALNCGDGYYAGVGFVRHPCYTHGLTYESSATANDQVNGLFPTGYYGTYQPEPLDAIPIRVLRMEATKS